MKAKVYSCACGGEHYIPQCPFGYALKPLAASLDEETPAQPKDGDSRECPECADKHQQRFSSRYNDWVHEATYLRWKTEASAAALVERAKPEPLKQLLGYCLCGMPATTFRPVLEEGFSLPVCERHAAPAVAVRAQAQEPLEVLIANWRKESEHWRQEAATIKRHNWPAGDFQRGASSALAGAAEQLKAVLRSLRSDREREAK